MATDHLRRTRYAKRTPVHADIRPVSEAPFQLFDPTVTEALQ
jgi:hypothetical protein